MEDKEAFAMIAAHAVSGMPYDQLMPAGWRYTPSEQWGDQLLTQDPKTAELARQHGREVEALYTEEQLLAAVGKAGTMGVQLAHWKAFAIHAEGEHAAWKKTASELDAELSKLRLDRGLVERAADMLTAYAELIRRDGATHVEEHHYLPEVEHTATELRARFVFGA